MKTSTGKAFTSVEQEAAVAMMPGVERRVLGHGGNLMLVHFRFPGGVTLPEHSHPHEQVGYVISGEVEFYIEGQPPARLGAGGSYYVAPGLKHYVVFLAPTEIIDAFTPMREDFLSA